MDELRNTSLGLICICFSASPLDHIFDLRPRHQFLQHLPIHLKKLNNWFVDAESGGLIFMVDGSCNSEVAVNSGYTVIGHSEGFSSQTAPETSPLVDWKTTATSIDHDAVEAANGFLPTDTGNDQDECLQPSNVATSSELGDYSEKPKGVRSQTGPCNVTSKTILSVERTCKIASYIK